jgi:hypothetical protein
MPNLFLRSLNKGNPQFAAAAPVGHLKDNKDAPVKTYRGKKTGVRRPN